ncbi:UDP-N-acetylmuramoyl-tripeptide--D-alanyl-D-alanine ligase [Candidatus Parcubacteria bacterium]|nr:UDP-N-acetylmuramoyl-tripeptide--D-alanyl-D-alanine ligase [Candidatus Parcubacteria bacterium]
MKELIKKIIVWKLNILAGMYLRIYKPQIVAVTGNVGKTSTKEAIASVLSHYKKIRSGKGNLNNEFGVPLTILGDWADNYYNVGNSIGFWARVIIASFFNLFIEQDYPEVLVLEYGADHPGDIKRLVKRFKPHVGVVTAVGDTPVHIEFFKDAQNLADEKSHVVRHLDEKSYAILNHDDDRVLDMKQGTKAPVLTYGFDEGSSFKISDFENRFDENGTPLGVGFKLSHGSETAELKISGSLGRSQAYSAAAAAAVAGTYGININSVSQALESYHGPKGRLRILRGIKNSIIIDDTYNASPASTFLALETIKASPKRKVIVLGDMLELGEHTIKAHQEVGTIAGNIANVLVCVGDRSKFIAEGASDQIAKENIYTFTTSMDAKLKVQELIQERDIVLVKGSQGMRMEKIVEEIMAEPQMKKDLLVRQGTKWLSK